MCSSRGTSWHPLLRRPFESPAKAELNNGLGNIKTRAGRGCRRSHSHAAGKAPHNPSYHHYCSSGNSHGSQHCLNSTYHQRCPKMSTQIQSERRRHKVPQCRHHTCCRLWFRVRRGLRVESFAAHTPGESYLTFLGCPSTKWKVGRIAAAGSGCKCAKFGPFKLYLLMKLQADVFLRNPLPGRH